MDAHGIASYEALLARSVAEPEWFWAAVLDEIGVEFDEPYQRILDLSRGPAWPRWCVGGRMNIVRSCLDKWLATPTADRPALRWEGEEGTTRILTYRELHALTNQCANGLRALGLVPGDRVALFMPMCPELVAAFFAVVKAGRRRPAALLRLRRGRRVGAPPGLGRPVPVHRRRLLAARSARRDAADGRRGCRRVCHRRARGGRAATGRLGAAGTASRRLGRSSRVAERAPATPSAPPPTPR